MASPFRHDELSIGNGLRSWRDSITRLRGEKSEIGIRKVGRRTRAKNLSSMNGDRRCSWNRGLRCRVFVGSLGRRSGLALSAGVKGRGRSVACLSGAHQGESRDGHTPRTSIAKSTAINLLAACCLCGGAFGCLSLGVASTGSAAGANDACVLLDSRHALV